MDNPNYSRQLYTQGTVTSLIGLSVTIMRIIVTYTVVAFGALMWLQLIMSFFCVITGCVARQAGRVRNSNTAQRYSRWSLINYIVWTLAGFLSTVLQGLALGSINVDPASFVIVMMVWTTIYFIGINLFFRYWRFAKFNYISFVNSNPNNGRLIYAGNEGDLPVQPAYYAPGQGIYQGQPVDAGAYMPGQPMPAGGYAAGQPYYFGNQGNYANPGPQPITPVVSPPFNPDQPPPARQY